MARTPKGSITRNPADWNFRRMYFSQITGGTGKDTSENLGLLNNSQDGNSLVLWDMTIAVENSTLTVVTVPSVSGQLAQIAVTLGMPTDGTCSPCIPGSPSSDGRMWDDTNAPGLSFAEYTFLQNAGLWQWPHDYPFAVIPPGWSYVVYAFGDIQDWSISVMFEQIINPYN